jgi:hypothetical protein
MSRYIYLLAAIAALVTTVPAPSDADNLPIVIAPRIYNFPGQQLCQVDQSNGRYRELCWPQSYHAFGASGYRPLGTYQPYRSFRRVWRQPNALIVHVEPQN